jgi:hypothetical protein
MLKSYSDRLNLQLDRFAAELHIWLIEKAQLLCVLGIVALAGYGFELFNLNLTIDEEVHAIHSGPLLQWIEQGRWGMYFLNRFLLPYTVVPFVPLFLALSFEIISIVLLLHGWGIKSRIEQILVGAVAVAFPTMAYLYTFSTLNFGIGIGLFCIALSLFLYIQNSGVKRLLAILPAAFALAIYQGFAPALASVFLIYLISVWKQTGKLSVTELAMITAIHIMAVMVYYIVQKLILFSGVVSETSYVAAYFDIAYLRENFSAVLGMLASIMSRVYSGDKSIYSIQISALGVLVSLSVVGFFIDLLRNHNVSVISKVILALFLFVLLLMPFASGILMRGALAMRFLVTLPLAIAGLTMLGFGHNPKIFRACLALLAGFCIFQFVVSTNRLFAASHLALQADRLLATRLIERIENAKSEENVQELKYIEIVGHPDRPGTELVPKLETFGASFFEWEQGNPARVVLFLQTIGYTDLYALPAEQRIQMIEFANDMPVWPQKGSIKIIDNTVLVKFGSYSYTQKLTMCKSIQGNIPTAEQDFCN